jgi:hypothetical protein
MRLNRQMLSSNRTVDVHIIDPTYTTGAVNAVAQSYLQAVAEGDIPGHTLFRKIGYHPATTAAETTLWNLGTAYVFPAVAISVEAISTSVNDTAAGSGADSTYTEKTFAFNMNGTTAVAGPTDFFRVNTFHVETGAKTAGVVSLRLVGGAATVYSQMPVGATRARNSIYTVPLGKTVYVQDVLFSAAYSTSGKAVRMILHASVRMDLSVSTTGTLFWPQFEGMLVDNIINRSTGAPLIFPAKTDIKVSVLGETNAQCTSEISGWIE